jgi:predicted nucleic-acid-binding protein
MWRTVLSSLDTNCLLRWILDDVPAQTAVIHELISSGKSFAAPDAVLIETVFVLEKVKKISRAAVEQALLVIIGQANIKCSRELFTEALPLYREHPKLSFIDCYLSVLVRRTGADPLFTFDQKLAHQLSGVRLLGPETHKTDGGE